MSDVNKITNDIELLETRLASRVTSLLAEPTQTLAPDVVERLRFAREQALARARAQRELAAVQSGGAIALGRFGGWWPRLAALLPVVALVAGLVGINAWNAHERARAAAEIDAVLLADRLPPAAYADPGFVAFLKLAQP